MDESPSPEEKKTYRKKVILPSDFDETTIKPVPKPVPKFHKKPAQVRMNTAAILREEARVKREEEAERQKLEAALIGLRDASEFENWKQEMSNRDEIERMELVQMRKIEMELTREEAIEAMRAKARENQLVAARLKEEAKEALQQKEIELAQELEGKKDLVVNMMENRGNIEVEKKKVLDRNKQIKEELQKEINEAVQRRKEEDAIEKAKRDEIIRQIRELEKQPVNRNKGFDPTEVMGYGLLEEMSLAQLKEKLEEKKRLQQLEIEKQRMENIQKKEQKANELMSKAKRIADSRDRQTKQAEEQRRKKAEAIARKQKMQQDVREKGMLQAFDKIQQKKQQRKREQAKLEKDLKEIRLKRQYLNASRALVEEKAWKEQEAGAEREARERQAKQLIEQERVEKVKLSETNLRAKAAKEAANQRTNMVTEFETRLAEAHDENEHLRREERKEKTFKHSKQRDFESSHRESMEKRQPYATKINSMSMSSAKGRNA